MCDLYLAIGSKSHTVSFYLGAVIWLIESRLSSLGDHPQVSAGVIDTRGDMRAIVVRQFLSGWCDLADGGWPHTRDILNYSCLSGRCDLADARWRALNSGKVAAVGLDVPVARVELQERSRF